MEHMFINKCITINADQNHSHNEHYMVRQNDYPYANDPRSAILDDAYMHTATVAHELIADCFDRKILTAEFYAARLEINDDDYPELNEVISVFWANQSKFCIYIDTPAINFRQEIAYDLDEYDEADVVYLPIASYFKSNCYGGTSEYILKEGHFTDFQEAAQWLSEFKAQNPDFSASFLQIRYFNKNTLQNNTWYRMNQNILQATNGCSDAWVHALATNFDETYCNLFGTTVLL